MALTQETRTWSIYKITSPTNNVYIGVTCDLKQRWRRYKSLSSKTQPLIFRSLTKYGADAHSFDIIETFVAKGCSEALSKEIFWIRTYMSNKVKYPSCRGLNLTDGGIGTVGYKLTDEQRLRISERVKGSRHSEATKVKIGIASSRTQKGVPKTDELKRKISIALTGKKASKETREKLSLLKKGKKINRVYSEEEKIKMSDSKKGFKHTEEARRKISDAGRGRTMSDKNKIITSKRKSKAVVQVFDNGSGDMTYSSIYKASADIGISRWVIHKSLRGLKLSFNFTFKYAEQC